MSTDPESENPMMNPFDTTSVTEITPEQFELLVKEILQSSGKVLTDFEVRHRERIRGIEGAYEIDVTARFQALGGHFLVLVECKHHRTPIKRAVVQVLRDRIQSTGAQKGMIFSTGGFQSGALEYAKAHGIALVRVSEGRTSYETRSYEPSLDPPPWANIPPYVDWWISLNDESNVRISLLGRHGANYVDECLDQ